ncbi:MAG TPA: hypothetical protein VF116_05585 [Ktedonobacterales bacterium]
MTVAWFLPWCTMHFGSAPAGGISSSPLAESPYALASQAVGWQSASLLLLIGLALVGIGSYVLFARHGVPAHSDVVVLALAACGLIAATYYMLGLMAVPQIITGHAAPGVYLVPGLGAAVMLAGFGLVMAACVEARRRL